MYLPGHDGQYKLLKVWPHLGDQPETRKFGLAKILVLDHMIDKMVSYEYTIKIKQMFLQFFTLYIFLNDIMGPMKVFDN